MDTASAIELIRRRAGEDVCARLFDATAEGEALVVSGSLIEGLGNKRSDLDLFLIGESHPRDVPVRMAFAGDSWVDIEYVRPAVADDLASKLGAVGPRNTAQLLRLSQKELDRYYRLAIGITVKGSCHLHQIFSLQQFRKLLRPWAIVHAGAFAARAAIALGAGDVTASVRYASHAAHLCAEGALTEVGEFYPSLKYTLEKAIRAYGADSKEVKAIASLLYPSGDLRRYVAEVSEYVDTTLAGCLSVMSSDRSLVEPAAPLVNDARCPVPAVLTRKTTYEVLPEDAAAVGCLLSLPGFAQRGNGNGMALSAWQAEAHRLVLREALIELGLLRQVECNGR